MSITDDIRARVAMHEGRRLFHLPMDIPGDYTVREVVVSAEVRQAVTGPWPQNRDGIRLSGFRGDLDAFTRGDRFSVAENPYDKPSNTMLARVDSVSDEIWDVRNTDPKPGIRGLGAFGGKNFLIVLVWDYRENFEGDADHWASEIGRCKAQWADLFGSIPRFRGASLDEYLSNYFAV